MLDPTFPASIEPIVGTSSKIRESRTIYPIRDMGNGKVMSKELFGKLHGGYSSMKVDIIAMIGKTVPISWV